MNKKKLNIGLVSWPILTAGVVPLQRLIHVLHPLSSELHVITGGAARDIFVAAGHRVYLYLIEQESTANTFLRVIRNISTQLKISWRLCRIARHVDFWIFFFGGPVLLLPMLTAKLLLKDAVLAFTGSAPEDMRAQVGSFISKIVGFLTKINCSLSNGIVIYSESLIKTWGLEKYKHKISIAHEHFLDFDKFKVQTPLNERANTIGYIGRLSEEKGILNFVEAIPRILETRGELAFLIGGDGQLRIQVEEHANKSSNKVKYVGWILHNELPHYLNEIKLLVLPSYTEGLPNIMLEAMACGTPVLATPVGSIPDVVIDGETGFILKDNSAEDIARNVIRALTHPNLERIATDAHTLVERKFTYETAVETYRDILASLKAKKQIEAR